MFDFCYLLGQADMVKLLIEYGAKINAVDGLGEIPLHYAAHAGT